MGAFGATVESAASRAAAVPRRVLVVDDDPLLRIVVADILRKAAHVVEEAEGGREGIERIRTSPVDLVLTDLRMRDLSGWDVARAARTFRPRVPVILMTGSPEGLESEPEAWELVRHILPKPFRAQEVLELVTMLAGEGESDGVSAATASVRAPQEGSDVTSAPSPF
jgi:CheY-like chemotaxis protein